MMKKIKLLLILGVLIGFGKLQAQDTLPISKNDLLQKVIEKNLQIKATEKPFNLLVPIIVNQMLFFYLQLMCLTQV